MNFIGIECYGKPGNKPLVKSSSSSVYFQCYDQIWIKEEIWSKAATNQFHFRIWIGW